MTKYALFAATLLMLAVACGIGSSTETLGERRSEDLEKEWLQRIIRYVGKLPPRATHATKFESRFDEYYQELAQRHRIDLYYQDEASQQLYLLVSRIAPSLYIKRVATGIRLQLAGDSLTYYEEVFRTWKMPEEELAEKGGMLFTKMVKGEDLSPYYPQNSGKEEFIEFPDEHTDYDIEKRVWRTKQPDVLEPYYELKE